MQRFQATYLPYADTRAFSPMVLDYLQQDPVLESFFDYAPTLAGIKEAILKRKQFPVNRELLVETLQQQYKEMPNSEAVSIQIASLADENTFTIVTAHQPNLFTGHLYFIYKIIHAIKLAEELNAHDLGCRFVPVYYMGSEDADLEELGQVEIDGKRYAWETNQTGAVGRMKIDATLIKLIDAIEGQVSVLPHAAAIMPLLKQCYTLGKTIEQATFELVHALFGSHGLVVVLPDQRAYKAAFSEVMQKELNESFSYPLVQETVNRFPDDYKVQVAGREINLFYLGEQLRERIVRSGDAFEVLNTDLRFTVGELENLLKNEPERFSPNVILRPLFQEMLLPDVVFIGGGGELAYWLELKSVFEAAHAFFPVLVLRNSYAIVNQSAEMLARKLNIPTEDLFLPELNLVNDWVNRHSNLRLTVDEEMNQVKRIYQSLTEQATAVDPTLAKHVQALQTQVLKRLQELEKKMLRAEKRKQEDSVRQIQKLKSALFPGGTLQERVDNIIPWIARYGLTLLNDIHHHARGLDQQFCVLEELATGHSPAD
ncbi:MAG TPA: bacillithiol biosynthesis cysteine-adding enzyme BshC [Ferruginibacter sp.]|nr:bacillithiol biosynthesis cysteine-adding enzyme BshC [Ferruginibacter sp.]